jgi:hypothetical protein
LEGVEHDIAALESKFGNCVDLNDRTANARRDRFIDMELLESEFGNCLDLNDRTANDAIMDMCIDMELSDETRILPLLSAPTFSEYDISKLQDCVTLIHSMCLQLPEDIVHKLCKRGMMYANYEIIPGVHEHYIIDADEGQLRSRCAHLFVEKALLCGGIRIDIQSAFWAHCHLPLEFSKWRLEFVSDPTCKLYQRLVRELLLFPEIDLEIVTKIAAMMMHSSWQSV